METIKDRKIAWLVKSINDIYELNKKEYSDLAQKNVTTYNAEWWCSKCNEIMIAINKSNMPKKIIHIVVNEKNETRITAPRSARFAIEGAYRSIFLTKGKKYE